MSTQTDLSVSYGLPSDFYRLWLDEGMNYSCAVFDAEGQSLEQAQANKLEYFFQGTRSTRTSRVLDIGCGWGGNLRYLARVKQLTDIVGITLSKEQFDYLQTEFANEADVRCVSYADFEPERPFDTVISIGMFEHLSTPEQARSGVQLEIYREYFRKAWSWTKPGAYFGLQSVIGARIPREREALRELAWATTAIFPGAISPRLEAIVASVNPYWEVLEVRTRRTHYARTSAAWLERLRANEGAIRSRWGNQIFRDYERYLAACVAMFSDGYQSLAQLVLKRVDRK